VPESIADETDGVGVCGAGLRGEEAILDSLDQGTDGTDEAVEGDEGTDPPPLGRSEGTNGSPHSHQASATLRVGSGKQGAHMPAPGVAHPVDRLRNFEVIKDVESRGRFSKPGPELPASGQPNVQLGWEASLWFEVPTCDPPATADRRHR